MRMKDCILLLFVSSCLARTSPERGRKMPFQSPMEIKTIVLACDQDKDGELNSKELEECVSSIRVPKGGEGGMTPSEPLQSPTSTPPREVKIGKIFEIVT